MILVLSALAALCAAIPARAALRAESGDALLVFESDGAREAAGGGAYGVFAWFRPEGAGDALALEDEAGVVWRLGRGADGLATLDVRTDGRGYTRLTGGAMPLGEWTLVTVSFDGDGGDLALRTRSASTARVEAALPGAVRASATAGTVVLGSRAAGSAMPGTYGLILFRDRALNSYDVDDLIERRVYLDAHFYGNRPAGTLVGSGGTLWMINHAFSTAPVDALPYPSTTRERAAIPGRPATETNIHRYEHAGVDGGQFRVVRAVEETHGFTHVSPFADGWMERRLPILVVPLPSEPFVRQVAPRTRLLARGETRGVRRVIVSANSRGVQRNDGAGERTGNYADALQHLHEDTLAGVLLRPATLARHPWAAFDAVEEAPWMSGNIEDLSSSEYSRFFTGSTSGGNPGAGVLLRRGAAYALRAQPFGMMRPDAPLTVRAHVLEYPGASDVIWSGNAGPSQGAAGQAVGAPVVCRLDTQRSSHVYLPAEGDSLVARTLTLRGTPDVQIGDACVYGGGINVVEAVSVDEASAGRTRVTLAHLPQASIRAGDRVLFGPWGLRTLRADMPALDPDDPNRWRGLAVEPGATGYPLALFAFDAWRTDAAEGFIVGGVGWGGNGFRAQIDQAFPGALEAWMRLSEADVWLQGMAQQDSVPASMGEFTAIVRAALPDAEIAWVGETAHGAMVGADWHAYMLGAAEEHGAPAVSILNDPRFGAVEDQIAAGLRSNSNHYSASGADAVMSAWLEGLREAALPAPADLDDDGRVGAGDLAQMLGAWGVCDACPADLDADGTVGATDLALLLAAWQPGGGG